MAEADARCLDEDTVILLAEGALSGHAFERAEEHLSQCEACRSVLAESMRDAERALTEPAAIQDPARTHELAPSEAPRTTPLSLSEGELEVPQPGTVLVGKYRVESVLGSGGMGVVLAATHLVLGSRVAIKVLRRPGPSEVARFLREAQVSAQIRNRNIARVFDFGQLPNGAPFLVMEYLEGQDLAQCIEHAPLSVSRALEYVLQACEALAEVHALGIVHRDLKPANLFLTEDHGRPVIKVLDFGIFKSIAGAALNVGLASTQLTGAQTLVGSPVYMSPEQMRGHEVSAQSDVWALGVILYELMTQQLPFGERTLSALAMAVATEEPTPPSRLQPGIPRKLEHIILRCLRKQPSERYLDAAALRDALLPLRGPSGAKPTRSLVWGGLALFGALAAALAWWSGWAPASQNHEPVRAALAALPRPKGPPAPPAPIQLADAGARVPESASATMPLTQEEPERTQPAALTPEKRARSKHARTPSKRGRTRLGPTDTPD
ncbi:MAG: Serine/threonine-protein kinase pkn3 [Myxococcaceae bacterium]|nr:Serine/threonine-protein kinase pkn3 [Myxococcaceae bacterium]